MEMIQRLEQIAHELDQFWKSGIIQSAVMSGLIVNHLHGLSESRPGVIRHHVPESFVLQMMLEHETYPTGALEGT